LVLDRTFSPHRAIDTGVLLKFLEAEGSLGVGINHEVSLLRCWLELQLGIFPYGLFFSSLTRLNSVVLQASDIVNVEDHAGKEQEIDSDEDGFSLAGMQRQELLELQAGKVDGPGVTTDEDDPFAHCTPKPPFEWHPKVKGFFEFYTQQLALNQTHQQAETLSFPTNSGFHVPDLDRAALRQLKEDMKASDRSKRLRAVGAFTFDKKVSSYQAKSKSSIKLLYEAARSLTDPMISKAALLKLNGGLVSLLFEQHNSMTIDRRESLAFYLGNDVDLAKNLALPAEGKVYFIYGFLFFLL
jgi:hypothetical protein